MGQDREGLCRVRESEPYLDTRHPVDIRLCNARRNRNAVRLALRNIEELSSQTEQWVLDELANLETFTTELVDSLSKFASTVLR